MEIEALDLRNFRQFYGEQRIEFSQDAKQNVTVIHGSNGSGKTTLLNAFIWLLYGEVDLPKAGEIANERAMAEIAANETIDVSVRLEFQDDGKDYTAFRRHTYRKDRADDLSGTRTDDEIELEVIDEAGNHKRRGNPEDSLKQIMPERLRDIFFFDGETIDDLATLGEQEQIQAAIRNIMGLEILERGKRHTKHVKKEFEAEMEEHGSDELSKLVDSKQSLETELEEKEGELDDVRSSRKETKRELSDVNQRLGELKESKGLQEQRNSLEDDLEDIEDDIDDINKQISTAISDNGYLPFAMPAVEETAKMLQRKRDKGEIPSEIKTQFVGDLLEIGECICGRDLVPGSEPYQEVAGWQDRAGSGKLEETAMKIATRLTEIGEGQKELYDQIEELLERRGNKRDRKREIEEEIAEISSKLSEKANEDVAQLEERRNSLESKISDYDKRIGSLEDDIDELADEIDDLEGDISDAREENAKAELARKRAQAAAYLNDRVAKLFDKYQDEVRVSINERVNETFQKIIGKDFYADIAEDYTLRILKDVGENEAVPVAQSTGERQVASLSFIASLVSLAKEQYESDNDATYFTGGIYPMIMDSPFGYLDPEYQKNVSSVLPEMAEQVVVLVTQSQWSDAVAGELDQVSGQRYHLKYHDPTEEAGTEYEYTEIVTENPGAS
jgi:DNA sulfur modification protein DndD